MGRLQQSILNEDWGKVRSMLESDRVQRMIRVKRYPQGDYDMVTVLHLLLATRKVPTDVLRSIIRIAPLLVQTPTTVSGELPLHYVVKYQEPPVSKKNYGNQQVVQSNRIHKIIKTVAMEAPWPTIYLFTKVEAAKTNVDTRIKVSP